MNYKLPFFFLSLLLSPSLLNAQNFVADSSFENYTNTFCGIMYYYEFDPIMNDWSNPTNASPQMFFSNNNDTCYNYQPNSQYAGPLGIKGNQTPRNGDAMAGIWLYTIDGLNQRHYVQTQLTNPLTAGNTYVVSFYVSLADSMEYAVDKVGAYLSTSAISATNDGVLNYTPQIESNGFISEISEWVLVSDTIVAQEAYSYLTIGNFYDDNATNTQSNPSASFAPGTYGGFYFLDDVSVIEIGVASVGQTELENIHIYPTEVNDFLNIETASPYDLQVYSMTGELVFQQATTTGQSMVNLKNLSPGTYVVTLNSENGQYTQKIIKK